MNQIDSIIAQIREAEADPHSPLLALAADYERLKGDCEAWRRLAHDRTQQWNELRDVQAERDRLKIALFQMQEAAKELTQVNAMLLAEQDKLYAQLADAHREAAKRDRLREERDALRAEVADRCARVMELEAENVKLSAVSEKQSRELAALRAEIEKERQQISLVEDAIPTEFEGSEEPVGSMVAAIVQERDSLRTENATLIAERDHLFDKLADAHREAAK